MDALLLKQMSGSATGIEVMKIIAHARTNPYHARSLILQAHEYESDDPKSLDSVTARQAARLALEIGACYHLLTMLPVCFISELRKRNMVKRYTARETKVRRKLGALIRLLLSYFELLEKADEAPEGHRIGRK